MYIYIYIHIYIHIHIYMYLIVWAGPGSGLRPGRCLLGEEHPPWSRVQGKSQVSLPQMPPHPGSISMEVDWRYHQFAPGLPSGRMSRELWLPYREVFVGPTAPERRGDNVQCDYYFDMKAKAITWPWLSYLCLVRSTAVCGKWYIHCTECTISMFLWGQLTHNPVNLTL